MISFGHSNPQLTQAIRRVARATGQVFFTGHAEDEMQNDGFDHADVLTCLRKGTAHGPEGSRCNVVHRGLHIRVVVGGLGLGAPDWRALESVVVVTVMKVN